MEWKRSGHVLQTSATAGQKGVGRCNAIRRAIPYTAAAPRAATSLAMTLATGFTELEGATRLGVASLIGLAIGLERQWSGHASGPGARFAGLRTFLLLGVLGGIGGLLASHALVMLAAVVITGGVVISVAAYVAAASRVAPGGDLDGTTEVAAIVVLALSALAGVGWLMVSSAAAAIVVLALSEKRRLHRLVQMIGEQELQAALQFAVLAVVVLPLLPEGPYGGPLAIRPRSLWAVVLAFCALNFASYVARRSVGATRGYGIAGALGGLLSSTAVTLTYSRRSRNETENSGALATGVIAACSVLIPRILVISTALNPAIAVAAAPYLIPPLAAGILFVLVGRTDDDVHPVDAPPDRSPLRFMSAMQMALAFQIALSAIAMLGSRLSEIGLYGLSVALGLTDMDALTVSMSSRTSLIAPAIASRALAVGVLANTGFKLVLSLVIGGSPFRRRAAAGLGTIAVATSLALFIL
jgi:uncharacterized membrane protein (DUF4010 family)